MANKNPEAIENDFKGLERLQNGETEEITKATAITHNVTARMLKYFFYHLIFKYINLINISFFHHHSQSQC